MKDTHRDTGDKHRDTRAQTHTCRHTEPVSPVHHPYTLDTPLFLSLGYSRGVSVKSDMTQGLSWDPAWTRGRSNPSTSQMGKLKHGMNRERMGTGVP